MQLAKGLIPPSRNGVGSSCIALPKGPWLSVIDFLVDRFPGVPRAEWLLRMVRGDVLDADGTAVQADRPYRAHAKLYYYRSLPPEARIPFDEAILFQDDYLVVADKPHFLPVTPSGRYLQETLLVRLKRKLGIDMLTPMHRIDRETAGLVLFTVQPQTRDCYQSLFRDKLVCKTYEAIAPLRRDLGLPVRYASRLVESPSFMQMCEVQGLPNAETLIELLEVSGPLARYRLHPVTGQKHQLRVHMNALGIPILHDQIYPHLRPELNGNGGDGTETDYSKPLQLLAKSVEFKDPISGQLRQFESARNLDFA
jgi:tRNA pseudouridine32 synthase/23S rRNA pseudouridine746 synthase